MGRRRKLESDRPVIRSYAIKQHIDKKLSCMSRGERSRFVCEALEARLGYDEGYLTLSICEIDKELDYHRGEIMRLEREKSKYESTMRDNQEKRLHSLEARQKLLEVAKNPQVNLDKWLDSRFDVLTECDFKDKESALIWANENKKKVVC